MAIRKNLLNFWLDTLMFADMLFIALLGLIMKYILPPGTGGLHRGGRVTFLWLGRHEWGSVHFILALVFLGLLAIHIILHWKWIVYQFKCTFGKKDTGENCDAPAE